MERMKNWSIKEKMKELRGHPTEEEQSKWKKENQILQKSKQMKAEDA